MARYQLSLRRPNARAGGSATTAAYLVSEGIECQARTL